VAIKIPLKIPDQINIKIDWFVACQTSHSHPLKKQEFGDYFSSYQQKLNCPYPTVIKN